MTKNEPLTSLTNEALLSKTKSLVAHSRSLLAELLIHVSEVVAGKLCLGLGFSSMFTYCTKELNFSEDAAYNRIVVARLARRLPAVLDFLSQGLVHLTGLRLLAPCLTEENHLEVL